MTVSSTKPRVISPSVIESGGGGLGDVMDAGSPDSIGVVRRCLSVTVRGKLVSTAAAGLTGVASGGLIGLAGVLVNPPRYQKRTAGTLASTTTRALKIVRFIFAPSLLA
jgi:hypothetical protein